MELFTVDSTTEVTGSKKLDKRIRITGFRKIRLYLRNGLEEEENVERVTANVGDREKGEEGRRSVVSRTGVKRKLNEEEGECNSSYRKKCGSWDSGRSNGLDWTGSVTGGEGPGEGIGEGLGGGLGGGDEGDRCGCVGRKERSGLECSPTSGTRKLRIVVHDRHNPFLVDSVFEEIMSNFSMVQLQNAILVSKRWRLFASNRMNHLLLNQDTTMFSDNDLNEVVSGLEKIQDMVNQRLTTLSHLRRERLTTRFRLWRDNGLHKQATASPPLWALHLQSQGFPLNEFRTYTIDEVFNWLISNPHIDYPSKEHWSNLLMESNIVAFVYRPSPR
jgi:hypothetical protein